ncbi:hypothetical protein ACHQM5_028408 [Ranunculus cassubicifolius]
MNHGESSSTTTTNSNANQFSYDDISRMSDLPAKRVLGHRRAHSEILGLPDDLNFDSDLGVVNNNNVPSFSDDNTEDDLFSMYLDMEKFNNVSSTTTATSSGGGEPPAVGGGGDDGGGSSSRVRIRHQHSQSMDGSSTIKPELLLSGGGDGTGSFTENKKAISSAKLADLALVDPKRAKRIWANRQSAARSKERKMRYISELERKVQTLQTEATTLSTQLTLLQRDANGLNTENNELKLRLHTMEQQVRLQDALNDALRDEVQRLKLMTGQNISGAGSMMNFGPPRPVHGGHSQAQQFYPNNNNQHAMHLLAAQQFQQLQIQQQSHQLLQQQQLQQQQQQSGDMKIKGSIPCPNPRESSSDGNLSGNDKN